MEPRRRDPALVRRGGPDDREILVGHFRLDPWHEAARRLRLRLAFAVHHPGPLRYGDLHAPAVHASASLLVLGFLLGLRHALDPDHVVAVAAIVARRPSVGHAARVGALWGLGHSATILLVGGVIAWFRLGVAEGVAQALEFGVALMLIAIGITNVRSRSFAREDSNARPALVGMMHGLAGSAAVALLVLATVADTRVAILYLAVFGLGTVVAMTATTALMALPLQAASERIARVRQRFVLVSGLASIAVGLWLVSTLALDAGLMGRGSTP